VWLLTTGTGADGDEWYVKSIHSSKTSAEVALKDYQKPITRKDGTTYTRQADIERWDLLTLDDAAGGGGCLRPHAFAEHNRAATRLSRSGSRSKSRSGSV
jgi:hypothetical protein